MANGFQKLANNFRVLGSSVPENAAIMVRKVALAIDQALVLGTPVLTGRARANWQVNIGAPAAGEVTGFPAATAGDSVGLPGASGTFAIQAAIAATAEFKGGSIFIVNNLPYIVPLNEGHSQQAPAGFVQTAILAGLNAVRGVTVTKTPEN